jgi:hypothetical protein
MQSKGEAGEALKELVQETGTPESIQMGLKK